MCSCINSSHSPTFKFMSESCNDSSHQSSLLTFMLAVPGMPSASLILPDSVAGSLIWTVASSSEKHRTQDEHWNPPFRLHLTPNNQFINKLKKTEKAAHRKISTMYSFIMKISFYSNFLVGFILGRGRELCKQICLVSVSVAKFPSCGTNFK